MKYITVTIILYLFVCTANITQAACPLDHISIGCNFDNEPNTLDDTQLYLDVSKKYRRSIIEGSWPQDYYKNWYYQMLPSGWGGGYLLGEPGLDFVSDPNQKPQLDFDLKIECVGISDGLIVLDTNMQPLIEQPGEIFDYTANPSYTHVHLTYRATTDTQSQWFTFYVYDALGNYEPSEICTIVFCRPPMPGDIHVDRVVDILDLDKLCAFWLAQTEETQLAIDGLAALDVFDGTDINRDYRINMLDFSQVAQNWLLSE